MTQYTGGCHCGAVRFEVEASLDAVITCNCSHCGMRGLMLSFVPAAQFRLLQGESALTTYLFNHKVIQHRFCQRCGIEAFGEGKMPDGSPTVAINVRCLDGVDWEQLTPTHYNGRAA